MPQKNTVVGTLSGLHLESSIRELWLGEARIFWNPAISSLAPESVANFGIRPNVDVWQDSAHSLPPARIAKLLIDVEFETKTDEVQGSLIHEELEKAVLPLRLGTRARILVSFAKVGGGTRDEVSAGGIPTMALDPIGQSDIATLEPADAEELRGFAQIIRQVKLDAFRVPIGLFSDSFHRTRAVDRGIDLLVALEALMSEGPESISFKVAFRAASLLQAESQSRKQVFETVKEAYRHRNTLVHGSRKRPRAEEWFSANNDELEHIVRKVLSTTILLLNKGVELTPQRIDDYLFDAGLLTATGVPVLTFGTVGHVTRSWHLL